MPSDEAVHVVVLCHANVARSVAAARLLGGATDERGVALSLRTAGTHATEGQPVSQRTVTAFAELVGTPGNLGSHRAHQLSAADVAWADLIVVMEEAQVRFVRRTHPNGADRTATLSTLAEELPADSRPLRARIAALGLAGRNDTAGGDIEDPAGGDDDAYRRAMAALVLRCGELATRLRG